MVFSSLASELQALEAAGLKRQRLVLEGPQGPRVRIAGREYLAFCSNDYLGLANHPALVEAAWEGAQRYGVGAGASHLITGHGAAHHELEEALAEFVGLPRALLFSTGYLANLGAVTALVGRADAVFADKLNHASLVDAALLSRAKLQRYPHLNLNALESLLARSQARRRLVATDAVFSMDGDIAPIPDLLALCERYDAWLLVDDAHGFGVLGPRGRGALAHFGAASPRLVYMATLGKAAGVFGAFVAGSTELVETLVQRARTYIYTTAMPPLLAWALKASLALVAEAEERRERLKHLVAVLREKLKDCRWVLAPSVTPIQPLLVGGNKAAIALAEGLKARGVLVPAIRPPTVPRGTARLRISLSAAHSLEDVERLALALRDLEGKLDLEADCWDA